MIKIGVDYYPEHWDETLWSQDADSMKEAGVKVVRLAEFSWSKLEPEEGEFHFEWLDRAIRTFEERGIDVILCTPTNCPPLWMYQNYPETIQTGRDGNKIAIGIRGHRCLTSPVFRAYANRIIELMTSRYSKNQSVVAWQIDNELDANFCCCNHCTNAYRSWLKRKYGTLEKINEAYGNNVWSGEYSDWGQVNPPMGNYPYAWFNPAYILDYHRFASDSMVEYIQFQTEIIRKNCPGTIVTTNTWFCEHLPDFYDTFRELDVVSYDNYPTTELPTDPEELYSHAFHLDLMRGIKKKNFWIMEQLSGVPGCWMPMKQTTRPGMIKGYSLQAIAHGADMVVHFRWRSAITGAETFWHGLLDQSNRKGRRFEEFEDLCKTVNQLPDLEGSIIKNQCAILYASDQEYALKNQPQSEGFHYYNQLKLFHNAFTALGVGTDIINQYENLAPYRIVVAPTLFVTDERVVKQLYDFVKNGGALILTNRSGVKDIHNNCVMEVLPTVYRELVGAYIEEFDPIGNHHNRIRMQNGEEYGVTQWSDILEVETAEVIATYSDQYYKGKAAVTKNSYGAGTAYYVGTIGTKDFYTELIKKTLREAQIEYHSELPDGVELTVREKENLRIYFLFNNTEKHQTVRIMNQTIELSPFEMHIWQE